MTKRLQIKIFGKVQGVSFRYYAKDAAQALGLTGYARNLSDGTVEIVAEGDEEKLAKLLNWSYDGSKAAKVDKVEESWFSPTGEYSDFKIEL